MSIKRLELHFWTCAPALVTAFLLIFCLIPKPLPGFSVFMPLLPLIPIFYWGLQQTKEMPYWFACLIGLFNDATTGLPLGLSALLYVLFLATLHAQRKHIHKEGFIIVWGAFAVLLAGMCLLQWVLLSFSGNRMQSLFPALMQWLLTVGCYPLLHKAFDRLVHYINMRRWKILHA